MVDRYTKGVLTVIAVSLAVIALRGGVPGITPAIGQSGRVHVVIDSVSSYALSHAGPLTIRCDSGCK